MADIPPTVVALKQARARRDRAAQLRRLAALRGDEVAARLDALAVEVAVRAAALEGKAESEADRLERNRELAARIETEIGRARARIAAMSARAAPRADNDDR